MLATLANLVQSPITPETRAIAANMVPVPNGRRIRQIDALVRQLKACGAWERIPALFVLSAHSLDAALTDWKNPTHKATISGSPVFEVDYGISVNDGSYVNSGYAMNVLFSSQNDCGMLVKARNYRNDNEPLVGHLSDTKFRLFVLNTANKQGGRVAALPPSGTATANWYDSRSVIVMQRQSSTAVQFYAAGQKIGADVAQTSSSLPTDNFCIGFPGSTGGYQVQVAAPVKALTADQHAAVDRAIMQYIGRVAPEPTGYPNAEIIVFNGATPLPDIPGFSPAGRGFTGTGIATLGGNLICGDDGRYGQESTEPPHYPHFHRISPAGVLLQSKDLLVPDGAMTLSASTVQGVTILGDGNIAIARTFIPNGVSQGMVQVFDPVTFTFIREFPVNNVNALDYDAATGLIVTAPIVTSFNITWRDPATGEAVYSAVLDSGTTTQTIDHMKFKFGYLWITKGANGSAAQLYKCPIAPTDGALVPVNYYRLIQANSVEGIDWLGDDPDTAQALLMNDSWFHESQPLVNEFQTYPAPPGGWG